MLYVCLLQNLPSSQINQFNFNIAKLKDLNSMLLNCKKLNSLAITFDTSQVTKMEKLFYNCESLSNLELNKVYQ